MLGGCSTTHNACCWLLSNTWSCLAGGFCGCTLEGCCLRSYTQVPITAPCLRCLLAIITPQEPARRVARVAHQASRRPCRSRPQPVHVTAVCSRRKNSPHAAVQSQAGVAIMLGQLKTSVSYKQDFCPSASAPPSPPGLSARMVWYGHSLCKRCLVMLMVTALGACQMQFDLFCRGWHAPGGRSIPDQLCWYASDKQAEATRQLRQAPLCLPAGCLVPITARPC